MSPTRRNRTPKWMRALRPEEVLAVAVARERGASRRYAAMARLIEDRVVKAKLRYLATEEVEHARLLRDMARPLPKPSRDFQPPKDLSEVEGELQTCSVKEALELAIEAERKARSFYENASTLCKAKRGREVFSRLATAEQRHEALLRQELALQRDAQGWRGLFGAVWSEEDFW